MRTVGTASPRVYADVVATRTVLFAGVALLAVPSALVLGGRVGPAGIPAAVVGCAVLAVVAGWPVGRRYVHLLAITGGSISLAVTAYVLVVGEPVVPGNERADLVDRGVHEYLGAVELIGLYLLIAALARWTTPLRTAIASGAVAWSACIVWLLRVTEETDPFIVLSNLLAAAVFPTVAAAVGGLPRFLAFRQSELVAATRREQRLELAQDLHDFVAHDLTGIVAQAQAARFARGDDADDLRAALERIESVGLAALDTMDGFVQVLHTSEPAPRSTRGIADLHDLVDSFRAEREPDAAVALEVDDGSSALSRQLQAAVYRVVVEGLTNVRRHAHPASSVTVSVGTVEEGHVVVAVTNDLGAEAIGVRRASGGTGLAALHERVEAVGGRLESGPDGNGCWRLRATWPATVAGDGGT